MKYRNLVVVHTLSKGFGLAGMRVGYIIAHKDMISYMNKMVNPYMVGELSREVAAEALRHREFVESGMIDFVQMKRVVKDALGCTEENPAGAKGKLHIAETSEGNTLMLLYHDDPKINLKEEFWKRGVLVIDGDDFRVLDKTSVRVRLPRQEEFTALLSAVRDINR